MLRIIANGDGTHRLENAAGTHIGWVRERSIGIRGIESETHALAASIVAWGALETVLRRQFSGWPQRDPMLEQLRIVRDEEGEWITDGAEMLARLHRPLADVAGDHSYAIELHLPSYANEGTAITAAQVIEHALAPYLGGRRAELPPTLPTAQSGSSELAQA